ncbi:MAG TPA: hypothetical protein VFQ68_37805, partial [Streptosporangiaceae bacterium]|nr:hypothetical protein [Streptosporangiaceae bacterium]
SRTLAMAAVALTGLVGGAVLSRSVSFGHTSNVGYSSTVASPAPQSTGEYVFACVNSSGKIDYLEFRSPLPHQCWFSGETLWHFAALPAVQTSPSPTPTPTTTPTPTPTPTPSTSTSSPPPAQLPAASSSSSSPSASSSSSGPAVR